MEQITIKNNWLRLQVLSYGAVIQSLSLLSADHEPIELVVGLNDPDDYIKDEISLGACIGRFAGRISGGGFTLDGIFYKLHVENGVHLHGGIEGFAKKEWEILQVSTGVEPSVSLGYTSQHMEEGYPGTLKCHLTYTLKENGLEIFHRATTDKPTIVNLTNHSYFRLDDVDTIAHYKLQLDCAEYLETGENLIPTGAIKEVQGTHYNFLQAKTIGKVKLDTPFVAGKTAGNIAVLSSDRSGIRMTVQSNQPAVIVYRPEHLTAICFETQVHPDAPNQPDFPSSVLRPGETYENKTLYRFERYKV